MFHYLITNFVVGKLYSTTVVTVNYDNMVLHIHLLG